jgi:acetylornithine deacetylase
MMTSREMLEQLVAFDTTSRESNLALIDFIGRYLTGLGVDYERFITLRQQSQSLCATWPAGSRWRYAIGSQRCGAR